MTNLFFYGTLRCLPLLEAVLGRDIGDITAKNAKLSGFRVRAVQEGPFPALVAESDGQAEGLLVSNLSDEDISRLDFYEGSFDYDLIPITLDSGETARVYICPPERWTLQGPWSLTGWQEKWADLSVEAAREVMGYYGEKTRGQVDAMFPMIRARAASRLNARMSNHGGGLFAGPVDVVQHTRAYADYFVLDDYTLRYGRFDGSLTDPANRAVFVGVDAAIVLPYDPVRDRVLLVEQFRIGPWRRGDKSWQLEPVAGRLDIGEAPEDCARREAREEAGIDIGHLEKVAECYPSPGTSSEFYHVYVGLCDLPDDTDRFGGLDAEQEDIRTHLMSFDSLMTLNARMGAATAPLVMASYWLAAHRNRLRSSARKDTG